MAPAAASGAPAIGSRRAHETSLVRLYVLRAIALFVAVDGCFTKLPYLTHPDPASRGIVACILVAIWLSAFVTIRYPLRMMPLFFFELIWKTLWLLDYGAPQWLAGMSSPRLARDLFEIGFFPLPIALVIPWGYVWRHYVRQPAERGGPPGSEAPVPPEAGEGGTNEVSAARLRLLRAAFLLSAIAGCALLLPQMISPDPAIRGMQESMLAGLWLCAFLGLRYPLQMLPILLFELLWTVLYLAVYALPRMLSGAATAQTEADLLAIAPWPILFAFVIPWSSVWRRFVREQGDRWR
ncbi:MAG: hypothetical protein JO276_04585 [Sphingomonadaceae bacterium]|nr:hypothetical protein [Sphingomonadaceae bacterium]